MDDSAGGIKACTMRYTRNLVIRLYLHIAFGQPLDESRDINTFVSQRVIQGHHMRAGWHLTLVYLPFPVIDPAG